MPLFAGWIAQEFGLPQDHPFYPAVRFLIITQFAGIIITICTLFIVIFTNFYKMTWLREIRNLFLLTKTTSQLAQDTHDRAIQTLGKVDEKINNVDEKVQIVEQKVDQIPQVLIESKDIPQKVEAIIEVKRDGQE